MASSNTAWGIEIGQYAVKAIQLERVGDGVRVRDFVVIPHQKVLTTPGLEEPLVEGGQSQAKTILEQTLAQLASQKPLANQNVVVNYNWFGNRGLTRFVKLPPGDAKTIAGLVPFEASQQIPFPLEEVEWDYHTFEADDSPEVDLGLFAVQREPLKEFLTLVSDTLGVEPRAISLGPVALYNAIAYDRDVVGRGDPLVAGAFERRQRGRTIRGPASQGVDEQRLQVQGLEGGAGRQGPRLRHHAAQTPLAPHRFDGGLAFRRRCLGKRGEKHGFELLLDVQRMAVERLARRVRVLGLVDAVPTLLPRALHACPFRADCIGRIAPGQCVTLPCIERAFAGHRGMRTLQRIKQVSGRPEGGFAGGVVKARLARDRRRRKRQQRGKRRHDHACSTTQRITHPGVAWTRGQVHIALPRPITRRQVLTCPRCICMWPMHRKVMAPPFFGNISLKRPSAGFSSANTESGAVSSALATAR